MSAAAAARRRREFVAVCCPAWDRPQLFELLEAGTVAQSVSVPTMRFAVSALRSRAVKWEPWTGPTPKATTLLAKVVPGRRRR